VDERKGRKVERVLDRSLCNKFYILCVTIGWKNRADWWET